ncbi:hypothetical protein I4U23_005258 [Adineta vaga]|nr:hypothetical protein I4U23_005258 [Adineta vaga]
MNKKLKKCIGLEQNGRSISNTLQIDVKGVPITFLSESKDYPIQVILAFLLQLSSISSTEISTDDKFSAQHVTFSCRVQRGSSTIAQLLVKYQPKFQNPKLSHIFSASNHPGVSTLSSTFIAS